MGHNEKLDHRITEATAAWNTTHKKMFGGTCHLLNGNMLCGVNEKTLILRLGRDAAEAALEQPHTRQMNVTGRPMKGWVTVEPEGFKGARLQGWLDQARSFVATLPPK